MLLPNMIIIIDVVILMLNCRCLCYYVCSLSRRYQAGHAHFETRKLYHLSSESGIANTGNGTRILYKHPMSFFREHKSRVRFIEGTRPIRFACTSTRWISQIKLRLPAELVDGMLSFLRPDFHSRPFYSLNHRYA